MRLINLRKILFAALGSVLGGLSGLMIILPLAGAIQAPPSPPDQALVPGSPLGGLNLPGAKIDELAAEAAPIVENAAVADRQLEIPSVIDLNPRGNPGHDPEIDLMITPGEPAFDPDYDREAFGYLSEVGFGAEYGSSLPVLHKWTEDVNLRIYGSPTPSDIATLTQVVSELNELIGGIKLTLDDGYGDGWSAGSRPGSRPGSNDSPGDLEVHFAPESQFQNIEPHYIPVNYGFFRVWWDHQGAIYRGRILVASEDITQEERSHLIREEVTQSMGLFQDSWNYPDSIFYQGWTATGEYATIDRPTIRLLYQPQLLPGMTRLQVSALLSLD